MALSLTISQARGGGDRQTRLVTQGTLSIGRASGNDWVLADPDQHLSRTHCVISFENGQYFITDRSTNGMLINGATTPTQRDLKLMLNDGDTILFGSYKMVVTEIEDADLPKSKTLGLDRFAGAGVDPFASAGGHDSGNPLEVDPFEDAMNAPAELGFTHPLPHAPPSIRMTDPFDALEKNKPADPEIDMFKGAMNVESWRGPTQRETSGAMSNAFNAPRALPQVNPNDIDFDSLLGDFMPGPAAPPAPAPLPVMRAAPPAPPMSLSGDPFADLLGDAPLGPEPVKAEPVRAAPPMPPARPPAARMPVAPPADEALEPSPFEEPERIVTVPQPPPAPLPAAAISPQAPAAAAQAAPAPAAAPSGAASAALMAAFLEGAGLPQLNLGAGDQEATMRALGALFRAFVTGTREVLMSRAEIKHEMRVEQTMIRSRDNNALKFSISADEALSALLKPERPGYKAPQASVEEAFEDIRSHEMALMAGMQTGLMELLKRFDPALLETRLSPGRLDSIMPAARKARFWELFCATYKDIAREAADDFNAVFGRDFARAYNAQIKKL